VYSVGGISEHDDERNNWTEERGRMEKAARGAAELDLRQIKRMLVCVFSVFVLSCVGGSLVTGRLPVQGVQSDAYEQHSETTTKERPWSAQTFGALQEDVYARCLIGVLN
jgi:hypothetical protein